MNRVHAGCGLSAVLSCGLLAWGAPGNARATLLIEANFDVAPGVENALWIESGTWSTDVTLSGSLASYDTVDREANASIITPVGSFTGALATEARMRVLSDDGYNGGGTSMVLIREGWMYISGIVPDNQPYHPASVRSLLGGTLGNSFNVDTSVFHTYTMVVTDTANGLFDIYVDNSLVLPGNAALFIGAGFDGQIQFGDTQSTADAAAELDFIKVYDTNPVPEPGVLGLVALGGFALWLRRRR